MDQVTLALWGLNKDYTVALVGLFGTIAGALIAFIGIRWSVNRQEKEKQLDHATKETGQALLKLMRLFRKPEIESRSPGGVTAVWGAAMTDQVDILKLTIPLFRNEKLRDRLNSTVDILADWHYVVFDGPNEDEYPESHPLILKVLQHAIDCVGAERRGARRLPKESDAFTTARNNISEFWAWDVESRA
ncbi:hypothetical protein ACIBSR_03310 [Streptomyces sp. NPDC049936]|uniref:hypothetical protein n=1 Tax=Streptomyces sp. NPDC049936 TaxID=3365599 RepID=UPI0037B050AB